MQFFCFVSAIHPEFPSPLPVNSTFTFASDLNKKGQGWPEKGILHSLRHCLGAHRRAEGFC